MSSSGPDSGAGVVSIAASAGVAVVVIAAGVDQAAGARGPGAEMSRAPHVGCSRQLKAAAAWDATEQIALRRYFKYDSVSKTSTCQIEDCQHVVSGDHGGNLERRLQRHHKEVYDNIQADKAYSKKRVVLDEAEGSPAAKHRQVDIQNMFKPISPKCVLLEITEDIIMNSCVELVTRNGRPFRLIDDSVFRKIIDPVLKALNAKLAITAETVKDRVQEEAKSKREEISQSLKNRMFSLKIDSASRLDRALLSINAQYAENGKLILQPLAMNEVYDRHTAEHLTSQVKNTLSRYDLIVTQVYSVTTDNGANMLKAARLLSETDDEPDASSSDEDDDSGYPEFGYCGSLLDDSEDGADFGWSRLMEPMEPMEPILS
ncbi:hypothetical protein HPB48_016523 [Haemaphysalis longicornis]|uniref:Uncharacterized protein n=1 Tax=Haemaphysalis longicornis TaxID=44386 RepID=A0A9J6GV46_HAELO|nr:hypothetical protein HPB48_016523 [Haemaphysalis longicornis]